MKIEERIESECSRFYQSVSESTPCGDAVEYNELFQHIEQQILSISEISQWRDLLSDCEKLMLTTRDLRVAVAYTRILIHTEKKPIEGVLKGFYIISKLLENFWDCLYPLIDIDDLEEAYVERSNTLAILGGYKELIMVLKKQPNFVSTGFEGYTLEEMITFNQSNKMTAGKQPPVGLTHDEESYFNGLSRCFFKVHELVEGIKSTFFEKSGQVFVDFDEYLIPLLQQSVDALSVGNNIANDTHLKSNQFDGSERSVLIEDGFSGAIHSRGDVEKSIDLMCEYYTNHEPSSPVPLLLKRAKRLINDDFITILEELNLGSPANIDDLFGKTKKV